MNKEKELVKIESFIEPYKKVNLYDASFEKLMFIYQTSLRELETKIKILKDEFELFYKYRLIDNIRTRIKKPQSIIDKMKEKDCEMTYKDMIENINDIAGIRVICPLKDDIFTVKNLIGNLANINVIKEKDYVNFPKKSGYRSYHQIIEVPVNLSQKVIYVKTEIQIRTMAMDFWATLEHAKKYKTEEELTKKESKELIACAQMIDKLEQKMANIIK